MNSSIHFDLLLPGRIVFGWNERRRIGALAKGLGSRAFLIDGSRTLRRTPMWGEMMDSLQAAGVQVESIATSNQEPTIEDVDEATAIVRQLHPRHGDFVIGIGGGAALDLAKAVAAMATNGAGHSIRDFLEEIGTGKTLEHDPLPVMAVPTTSGTGSEATKNAVVACTNPPCKKSLRSEKLVPAAVLLDPELTVPLPPEQTAYSGMDAITQLLESYFCRRAQPATDAWCDMGLKMGLGSLLKAYHSPTDRHAREEMAAAAMLSGMALANSGLGMAHGVAAALGAICNVPHGLACAVMLPITLKTNRQTITDKAEELKIVWRQLKQTEKMNPHIPAIDILIANVESLCRKLQIPSRLRDLGVERQQIPAIVSGSRGSSMSANPRDLTDEELTAILEENW
ncbi:iron-containing alcohol dehydrogenase [Planctomicrobium sp. SH661]|uniref:iron-containing alcohol dehydrogenase n=1 Tax=Planctomicrobium sp. SH661 TaxID=3448124 RepID=UPI003F5C046D